jgi:hypothetical protein
MCFFVIDPFRFILVAREHQFVDAVFVHDADLKVSVRWCN